MTTLATMLAADTTGHQGAGGLGMVVLIAFVLWCMMGKK